MPKLSDDGRKELSRHVSTIAESGLTSFRNIRRNGNELLHKASKASEITEDEERKALNDIQESSDNAISEIDRLLEVKEADILEV